MDKATRSVPCEDWELIWGNRILKLNYPRRNRQRRGEAIDGTFEGAYANKIHGHKGQQRDDQQIRTLF